MVKKTCEKALKSSKKVSDFLEKNKLHKKEFAQMIGVTLSYVYNIIDESISFSTRSTTIERIAAVMGVLPEEFEEYVIEDDPLPFDKNLAKIKEYIKKNKMSVIDFLKSFERRKRLKIVDMLRGAEPLPVNYAELKAFKDVLHINNNEFYDLWKNILKSYLDKGGFDTENNKELTELMLNSCEKFIKSAK